MIAINTSIFELLKIGPGPSSSHTIAPMKAGYDFMNKVRALPIKDLSIASKIEIRLFGSLSATGKGHGTHRAVLCGILGNSPDSCSTEDLTSLEDNHKIYILDIGSGYTLPYSSSEIIFDCVQHSYPHSNTLIFRLYAENNILLEQIYYSIGGGFLRCPNYIEPPKGKPLYPYSSMTELKALIKKHCIKLHELMLANEIAITKQSLESINDKLDKLIEVMEQSVILGIRAKGLLPGPIGLQRKAHVMYTQAKQEQFQGSGFLKALNAYALAASEENAAGHCVVTAPTCGASGVLPAIIFILKYHMGALQDELRNGLIAAIAIGFLCKHNASISGAEVGCQGEVGVASAMAAALITYTRGCSIECVENAAEIAMEHHLGLTCDPVEGYVQIPCIERNAMGVVKAYNAYLIASTLDNSYQKVNFDKVVAAMAQTGKDMSCKYKETSLAGLAQSMAEC